MRQPQVEIAVVQPVKMDGVGVDHESPRKCGVRGLFQGSGEDVAVEGLGTGGFVETTNPDLDDAVGFGDLFGFLVPDVGGVLGVLAEIGADLDAGEFEVDGNELGGAEGGFEPVGLLDEILRGDVHGCLCKIARWEIAVGQKVQN